MEIDESNLTPAMKQFVAVKKKYPDCLVLFRMGDFYETFYNDAITASRDLEITLTSRGKGEKKAPLAGIPYHALDNYLARLVKKGHKVAIVEQVENPKEAKGLVKRDVVRVVTPGTIIESSILDSKSNNYLSSLYVKGDKFSLALCDISTGEFLVSENKDVSTLSNEIIKFAPKECIIPLTLMVNHDVMDILKKSGVFITDYDDRYFQYDNSFRKLTTQLDVTSLDGFGIQNTSTAINASGALLYYIQDTQFSSLNYINKISLIHHNYFMTLDSSTLRNLELLKNIKDNTSRGSLLSVLDKTVTSMGSRLIKKWIVEPLLDVININHRLDAVEFLKKNTMLREELISILKGVTDIERLISRVNYGSANARDLISLKVSLIHIPFVCKHLRPALCDGENKFLSDICAIDDFTELINLLNSSIMDDPPLTLRDGNMIKHDFNQDLKQLYDIKINGKKYIQNIEAEEKAKTGIKSLKIGFNRVFGYFIEVSKSNSHLVPENYVRKQTRVNSERYITESLKEQESAILGAQEKIDALEYEIFQDILKKVAFYTQQIQDTSKKVATLDVLLSFAKVSAENNYIKPLVEDSNAIYIQNSRHPVVEQLEKNFVPNTITLNNYEIMVITGPNMAGKSTVLRQIALNVLMAQIGCFCAASEAEIGVVDRIFTRVGAYDDLTMGQSTFMVEMIEAANILNNATNKSLIILDEIGRGTSTFDGVSLAWSIVEYIYNRIKAKTMFATHYHILNKLETQYERVKNYNIAVKENDEEIIFLHKLILGGTDKSYGIHVAKIAGLPKEILDRARNIQAELEEEDEMMKKINAKRFIEQKTLLEI
jgi:DNA mismatch repair protein MutS